MEQLTIRPEAVRFIKNLRGGAQAHLIECSDGLKYAVKFRENPQHRRILVNEWIASVLAKAIGLPVPNVRPIVITATFLEANPDVNITRGTRTVPVAPGLALGSEWVGDNCFEFLPDALLTQVDPDLFLGAFVFDKWLSNADGRQCVFHRSDDGWRYSAKFIDHGYCFDGPRWECQDSPHQGLYSQRTVYRTATTVEDFRLWIDRVRLVAPRTIRAVFASIPSEWLETGEPETLQNLCQAVIDRRLRCEQAVHLAVDRQVDFFTNWQRLQPLAA